MVWREYGLSRTTWRFLRRVPVLFCRTQLRDWIYCEGRLSFPVYRLHAERTVHYRQLRSCRLIGHCLELLRRLIINIYIYKCKATGWWETLYYMYVHWTFYHTESSEKAVQATCPPSSFSGCFDAMLKENRIISLIITLSKI